MVKAHSKFRNPWLMLGLAVGLCHLILVAIGTFEVDLPESPLWSKVINYYGEISGSSSSYGFFAPGVGSQIRAVFDVVEKNSKTKTLEITDVSNREVSLRLGDIIEQFENDDVVGVKQMKFQRDLSASLSSVLFERHPGAKSVTIRLEEFNPVSMQDFRFGTKPVWTPLYSAEFINHKSRVR